MLPTISLVLHSTIILASLVLVGLSLFSFYRTGHAMKTMATEFPADRYIWFRLGVSNPRVMQHMVRLAYDWTTENLIFMTSGLSVVAGFLGLIGWVVNKGWRGGDISHKLPSTTEFLLEITLAFGAFGSAVASIIWSSIYHAKLGKTTCAWQVGLTPNAIFTCTRELAACNILRYIVDRNESERRSACRETKSARMTMIPLAVFSFILTVAYAVQRYRDTRARNRATADKRVERLQEEE